MDDRSTDVALLDAGEGRRLERLGPHLVDRPASIVLGPRLAPGAWSATDLRFDVDDGWSGRADPADPWTVRVQGLTLELRATASGGIGLYPEHAANLRWLEDRVRERVMVERARDERPGVLNLFAHTGLATLAAARAGAAVAHVDGTRGTVAWARRNAARSGLDDRPVRWLVDDALAFVEREARRDRRYAGFVVDPPSFGRADGGRWRLRDDLGNLLDACARIASEDAFVLLTAHTTGLDPRFLVDALGDAFDAAPGQVSAHSMTLVAESGAELDLGWAIRLR